MRTRNQKDLWVSRLDTVGFLSISVLCFLYIVLGISFAETCVHLFNLNFPIFISEIVLTICLVLYIAKMILLRPKFTLKNWLVVLYFGFVLFKTAWGYWKWGPLALREGMLLFYPIFVVFAYSFFRPEVFRRKTFLFLMVVLIAAVYFYRQYMDYWTLPLLYIALIFLIQFPPGKGRIFLWLLLLVSLPYSFFFRTSRMMILGNTFSWLFFCSAMVYIADMRLRNKLALLLTGIALLGLGMYQFADHNRLRSIVSFGALNSVLNKFENEIECRKSNFSFQEKRVQLYNPNTSDHLKKQNEMLFRVIDSTMESVQVEMDKLRRDSRIREEQIKELSESSQLIVKEYRRIKSLQAQPPAAGTTGRIMGKEDEHVEQVYKALSNLYDASSLLLSKVTILAKTPSQLAKETGTAEIKRGPQQIKEIIQGEEASREFNPSTVNNAVFRILIWKDMLEDWQREKPVLGFDLGRPFRSKRLEVLKWGESEWGRDGWVAAHNSYFNILYRAGIVGVAFLLLIMVLFVRMAAYFLRHKLTVGLLLISGLIAWFTAVNFLVILEVPYTAIPIWSLFGVTLYYYHQHKRETSLC